MKVLILIINVLLVLTNCNNTETSSNQEQLQFNIDFKKYHVPDEHLKTGIVRVYENESNGENLKTYRLIKGISENKFFSENYNSNFEINRKDVYEIENDGFIEANITLYKSGNPKELKIIAPKKFSFDPENQNCKSEYILKPTKGVTMKYLLNTNYIGKSTQIYKGKEIDCLEFKLEIVTEYTDLKESVSKTKTIITNGYYGEYIGFMGGVAVSENDTSKTHLVDIISVEKFEKLKKQ